MYHYTYLTKNKNRYYIGVRTCKCLPWEDKYMGSFSDKSFKPTDKIILSYHYSRKDAVEAEIFWHNLFDVARNPLFANRAKQKSTGFDYRTSGKNHPMYGKPLPKKVREKISKARMGMTPWNKGKPMSKEQKKKLSEARKGRTPWNKGKKGLQKASKEARRKMSEARSGEKNHLADKKKYLFIHKTGIEEIGTRYYLKNKYNLKKHINEICNGRKRTYKGWICTCLI